MPSTLFSIKEKETNNKTGAVAAFNMNSGKKLFSEMATIFLSNNNCFMVPLGGNTYLKHSEPSAKLLTDN